MEGSVVIYIIFLLFRSGMALVFGTAVSLLFAGVQNTRASKLATAIFLVLIFSIQILTWSMFGLQITMQLYPFITHLPSVLLLTLYFRRPWSFSISSVLTAYLCCQIPRWMGSVAGAVFSSQIANHIGYFVAMCVVYYFL
jgi:hypothetical protein